MNSPMRVSRSRMENTKLSSSTTVARYIELVAKNDRQALGKFIVERFDERYFRPINDSPSKHGFGTLAVACLVIESLESFYQGRADTRNTSRKIFRDFLARNTPLNILGGGSDWFFSDIRCAILHQSESRGGWRVLRSGPLVDKSAKTINATKVLLALKLSVQQYADQILTDEILWRNFKKKMAAVCDNCR